MKSVLPYSLLLIAILASPLSQAADQPMISKNVHVMKNATAAQCTSSYRGTANPDVTQYNTALGQTDAVGAAVRSCSGCAIDPASHDCVCRTCFAYSN